MPRYKSHKKNLVWAAQNGLCDEVRDSIIRGADVNHKDCMGYTPLYNAAENGHEDVVQLLLELGADLYGKDQFGQTALHMAAKCGNAKILKLLLDKGATITDKDGLNRTPLHTAAFHGQESVVRLLLELGANICDEDNIGHTPLHLATQKGHENIARLLLDKAPNTHDKANLINSALLTAAMNGNESVVVILLNKGADVRSKSNYGETALHSAAKYGHKSLVTLFLDKGVNIHEKDKGGSTALHYAVEHGHENVVALLLDRGANIHERNNEGSTPLLMAAVYKQENVLKFLLEKGANIRDTNDHGSTALHMAALNGHENIARVLLNEGANIHDKQNNGNTALHVATYWGYKNIVKLLLDRGAKADEKNNKGEIALDLARTRCDLAFIEMLRNHNALNAQVGSCTLLSSAHKNTVLVETLVEIACNQVEPSMELLKQKLKPENVVDVESLLAAHNIVLVALRGGLLGQTCSKVDTDPDWFKNKLYQPVCNKTKSREEKDKIMKVVDHAESLGIIRNPEGVRQTIIVNEEIEREMQTMGTFIADIFRRINHIHAGIKDLDEHSKSLGRALRQLHQVSQAKYKMDIFPSLVRLVISSTPLAAMAADKAAEMGFELLLTGANEFVTPGSDKLGEVDLADLRIAQWIVSEEYQQRLPQTMREAFEKEAQQTYGGMQELEDCIHKIMSDNKVVPLNVSRRSIATTSISPQAVSASASTPPCTDASLKRKACTLEENDAKRHASSNISKPSSDPTEWARQYNKYLGLLGEMDIDLGDAVALASKLSGKDKATCQCALRQEDPVTPGRCNRIEFVFAMEKLCAD